MRVTEGRCDINWVKMSQGMFLGIFRGCYEGCYGVV